MSVESQEDGRTRDTRVSAEREADPRIDLAVVRTELALERTQLAWVRTVFTLITAGLAVDKGTAALHEARVLAGKNWVEGGHIAGIILTTAGTLFLLLATVAYYRQARVLARIKSAAPPLVPGSLPISLLVVLLGGLLTILLLTWS